MSIQTPSGCWWIDDGRNLSAGGGGERWGLILLMEKKSDERWDCYDE